MGTLDVLVKKLVGRGESSRRPSKAEVNATSRATDEQVLILLREKPTKAG